ncbi:cyclase family protein [Phytohabitans rumicis]|uniref:cyclase family protein n=1 Tax=Phytohabitans rumicis TaxID=1076125 RepID=UPI0015633216|nr:cyclase family protein [Phytohabitans rumicis]
MSTEYRASFDADITFSNGGGLQAQGFRLDVPDADVTEAALADLLVRHLGLLMVDEVRLRGVRVFAEPHKGSRGGPAPAPGPRRLVELSHVITAGMTTYPGLPGPEITPHLTFADSRARYAPGTEFTIGRISMVGNTGTYLDSPYHRYAGGTDLAGLPLDAIADLPAVVVRLAGGTERGIGPKALAPYDVAGAAVLLHTGWDRHWGTPEYGVDAPFLTEEGANALVDAGARLVGIDAVNIDSTDGGERPAHSILLAAGVPVLEHLTGLDQVPVTGARLHAAPPRVRDFGTFPVRAYAVLP